MEEIWKPVKVRGEDFTGYYEVSNLGRIKNCQYGVVTVKDF